MGVCVHTLCLQLTVDICFIAKTFEYENIVCFSLFESLEERILKDDYFG